MTIRASLACGATRILAVDVRPISVSYRHSGTLLSNPDKNGQQHEWQPSQYWPPLFAATAAALAARDEHKRESHRSLCMPLALSVAGAKGGRRSGYKVGDIPLDRKDSSDQAFGLVVNHRFKFNNAIKYTKTPVSYNAIWQRVDRYKNTQQLRQKETEAAQSLASLSHTTPSGERGGATPSVTPQTSTARKGQQHLRKSPPTDLGIATCSSSPKPLYDREAAAVAALS